jgi:hypothetical protein
MHVEVERLTNSIFHLNRSNAEITEFDPNDPELCEAVGEPGPMVQRGRRINAAISTATTPPSPHSSGTMGVSRAVSTA